LQMAMRAWIDSYPKAGFSEVLQRMRNGAFYGKE
jgi:hypothetical protein